MGASCREQGSQFLVKLPLGGSLARTADARNRQGLNSCSGEVAPGGPRSQPLGLPRDPVAVASGGLVGPGSTPPGKPERAVRPAEQPEIVVILRPASGSGGLDATKPLAWGSLGCQRPGAGLPRPACRSSPSPASSCPVPSSWWPRMVHDPALSFKLFVAASAARDGRPGCRRHRPPGPATALDGRAAWGRRPTGRGPTVSARAGRRRGAGCGARESARGARLRGTRSMRDGSRGRAATLRGRRGRIQHGVALRSQ